MDLGQTSTYLTHSSESLVALDFSFSIFLPAKVSTQIFFVRCIASLQISEVYQSANRKTSNLQGKSSVSDPVPHWLAFDIFLTLTYVRIFWTT
jgi:hypothetical protein